MHRGPDVIEELDLRAGSQTAQRLAHSAADDVRLGERLEHVVDGIEGGEDLDRGLEPPRRILLQEPLGERGEPPANPSRILRASIAADNIPPPPPVAAPAARSAST